MTRYHLSLGDARKGRQNGAFKRGRRPARITAAQVDHVINAMQPAKKDYSFARRMEIYERGAAEDAALYAWLEARGLLPPPGELPESNAVKQYNAERLAAQRSAKREQAAKEARS